MLNKRSEVAPSPYDPNLYGGVLGLAVTFHTNASMEQGGGVVSDERINDIVDAAIARSIEDGANSSLLETERHGIVQFLLDVQAQIV